MGSKGNGRSWWRVTRNEADAIDIDIYGDIGESVDWWTGEKEGIGAKAFLDTLREAKGKAVNLHVNSAGGSVVDALAMMTAIANHDGKVTAFIDGLAASAASFLVAAADEVVMSSVAWMMIHDATLFTWGNSQELREAAEYLEKTDAHIASIYAKRSGDKSAADFAAAMDETTWFDADEALEWGLVDRIEEAVAAAACFTEDASMLAGAPAAVRDMVRRGSAPGRPAGDMGENMLGDAGEPGGQEPPAAQERAVWIDYRPVKIIGKERE